MPVDPILRPPSLKEMVLERLQAMLIERVFEPGDHLVESDLAERLGVSRGPVREALQELERAGWIVVRPRQGAFVHDPSDKEITDFFEMRSILEAEAARLAARRSPERAGELLRPIIEEARAGAAGVDQLAGLTSRFHMGVTRLADNAQLERLVTQLNSRTRWYFRPLVESISERAWDEHAAIAEALSAGDEEEASQRMREHIAWSLTEYQQHSRGEARSEPA